MKSPSITALLPSAAIAAGVTALVAQPAQALDYSYANYNYEDWSYTANRAYVPSLEKAYRSDAPAYHYAYYSIARPEYLL